MNTLALAWIFLLTLQAQPASAYLDPGSGSMLVAGLVGLIASLLFFLKGLYYKSRHTVLSMFGRAVKDDQPRHDLVFFSEGRQYWNTFKPLIDELISRGERCLYLTSDEQDPGLLYASDLVNTKYIGSGTKAYAHMAVLEADVCAMTTPGLNVLQLKRSKGVAHYANLVHAPTDMGTYKQYSFDYYDSIFCSGEHQVKSLRKLEELRGTKRKGLPTPGCLYFDNMVKQLQQMEQQDAGGGVTVLVAPTWGANGLLSKFGEKVLIPLLRQPWKIIVRPHPQSYISERNLLDPLREELKKYSNLHWDDSPDGLRSMAQAQVMISDVSGVVFDFAFLLEKPVITFKFDINKLGQESANLPWDLWELTVLDMVGPRITENDLPALAAVVEREIGKSDRKHMIRRLRDESVTNFGCAAPHVATQLLQIRDEVRSKQANWQPSPNGTGSRQNQSVPERISNELA